MLIYFKVWTDFDNNLVFIGKKTSTIYLVFWVHRSVSFCVLTGKVDVY